MHAVRNIRLCTKDCLCLDVCPTGATDTETGQIDGDKCIGCGICANACPSHAISMVPEKYPVQQNKTEPVKKSLFALARSKADQENVALQIAKKADDAVLVQLMEAAAKSNHLMAEDILREAGYMLPQSRNTHEFLKSLAKNPPAEDFPVEAAEKLLSLIPCNE